MDVMDSDVMDAINGWTALMDGINGCVCVCVCLCVCVNEIPTLRFYVLYAIINIDAINGWT